MPLNKQAIATVPTQLLKGMDSVPKGQTAWLAEGH